MNSANRILLVGNKADMILKFRFELIQSWLDMGYDVHVAAPDILGTSTQEKLHIMGVSTHSYKLNRVGQNPFQELQTLISILRVIIYVQPTYMLCYTIKPVIYGMLAGRLARVPARFCMITGLGYAFVKTPQSKREAKKLRAVHSLYKMALSRATAVFYQNPDDQNVLLEAGILSTSTPQVRIYGSGVNLKKFVSHSYPDTLTFIMVSRFLRDKGVLEFIEAVKIIKRDHPNIRFILAGGTDKNPEAIPENIISDWAPLVEMPGWLEDVREVLSTSSVFVLPSYREGTPKSTLEAMAMSRPVITTDAPGCRETIIAGRNGYLVPVRDSKALAQAMMHFIEDPTKVKLMGTESLEIARELFDVNRVNHVINTTMGLSGKPKC